MKRNITYNWGEKSLLITLGNRVHNRIKALYIAELVFTVAMATTFLILSMPLSNHVLNWVAATGAATLLVLATYRFLIRMFFSEQLLIDERHITIIRKTLLSRQVQRHHWHHLGPLHYADKRLRTGSQLKGKYFDYLGLETREQFIHSLHHEGDLYFEVTGGRVYFASGLYSWDAEKMVQMLKLYLGNTLKLGPEWNDMLPEQEFDDAPSGN